MSINRIELNGIAKVLAEKFEEIKTTNKISYTSMQKDLYEEWNCSEAAVKQYLDQNFMAGLNFKRIHPDNNGNNNYKQEGLTAIEMHANRTSQIIELLKPSNADRQEIYSLLNKINPEYFK